MTAVATSIGLPYAEAQAADSSQSPEAVSKPEDGYAGSSDGPKPDVATLHVDTPVSQASSQVEQNEPRNIFGEERTFVVRVWDLRDGSEGDVEGSTTITTEIKRSGMALCADLVGKLRKDGFITYDDFKPIVFHEAAPLVGFDAMRPLSYFGIGRGSILDIKLHPTKHNKFRYMRMRQCLKITLFQAFDMYNIAVSQVEELPVTLLHWFLCVLS